MNEKYECIEKWDSGEWSLGTIVRDILLYVYVCVRERERRERQRDRKEMHTITDSQLQFLIWSSSTGNKKRVRAYTVQKIIQNIMNNAQRSCYGYWFLFRIQVRAQSNSIGDTPLIGHLYHTQDYHKVKNTFSCITQ